MSTETTTPVRRVRRVGAMTQQQQPLPQGTYRGFGAVSGETLDEFHDRMYNIDPLEAMTYEMEVALTQC